MVRIWVRPEGACAGERSESERLGRYTASGVRAGRSHTPLLAPLELLPAFLKEAAFQAVC